MRDKARSFPLGDSDGEVVAMRVWHCSYKSLAPLARFKSIRTLVIATYPDGDLAPFEGLTQLEYLSVVHLAHVTDLAPLGNLTALRTLRVATLPSWDLSGKVTSVRSLGPLADLPALEHLELLGVVAEDE